MSRSQYDGANIEQEKIGYGWHQNQEAKMKIVGGDLPGSNQQDLDRTIHSLKSVSSTRLKTRSDRSAC